MKIKYFDLILLLIISGCILSGCSRFSGYEKTESGLYYKFYNHKAGVKPATTNVVTINLTYRLGDSLMFNSNQLNEPMNLIINKSDYRGDVNEALMMMCVGDSASFLTRADSFFYSTMKYNRLPKGLDEDSKVTIEIGLRKIQTSAEIEKQTAVWQNSLKIKESEIIRTYMKNTGFEPDTTPEGLFYKELLKGTGPLIQKGNIVTLNFAINTLEGKKLYSTWEAKKPFKLEFGRKFDTEGFNIALTKMSKGSKARLVIPSKLAFGEKGREGFINPYAPLLYDVEILNVQSKEDIEKEKLAEIDAKRNAETGQISEYIQRNKIIAQPTASGLYCVEIKKGKGAAVIDNKKVRVHYTGFLLNGQKFDSSLDRGQPFEFVVGKGSVIKGWDEGLKLMKVGGKSKLIIPSQLAYGDKGSPPKIPAFAPLVFEIEVLGIE